MIDSTPGEVQSLFPETLPPIFQTFILFNQLNRNPMRQDKVWTVSQAGSQRRSTPERLLATQVEPLDGKKNEDAWPGSAGTRCPQKYRPPLSLTEKRGTRRKGEGFCDGRSRIDEASGRVKILPKGDDVSRQNDDAPPPLPVRLLASYQRPHYLRLMAPAASACT